MSKIQGLDGKEYTLKLKQAEYSDENRSQYHLTCRQLLKEMYPRDNIFEEIVLPGTDDLTVDFIIPLRRLILEVQGGQHYEFNKFFHKTLGDFQKSKERDALKKEWCDLNKYNLVLLNSKNNVGFWQKQILNIFNEEPK